MSNKALRLVENETVDKNKALEAAVSQIERAFGKGSIMKMGQDEVVQTEVISTGSIGLDIALGMYMDTHMPALPRLRARPPLE